MGVFNFSSGKWIRQNSANVASLWVLIILSVDSASETKMVFKR